MSCICVHCCAVAQVFLRIYAVPFKLSYKPLLIPVRLNISAAENGVDMNRLRTGVSPMIVTTMYRRSGSLNVQKTGVCSRYEHGELNGNSPVLAIDVMFLSGLASSSYNPIEG